MHIDTILISKRISSSQRNYKYFIDYMGDDYIIKPFRIIFPKTSTYVKRLLGETKWMYFLIEDNEFKNIYIDIWDKVSESIKNNFKANSSTIKNF